MFSASVTENAWVSRRGNGDTGDLVGLVFTLRQFLRHTVRRAIGQSIDGRAAYALLFQCIGMQGDEKIGVVLPRDRHAFGQGKKCIGIARQEGLYAGLAVQALRELLREHQGDDLFLGACRAT